MALIDYRTVKRLIDISVSAPALLLASPLMAVIAIAVKLNSRGPALYGGARLGLGGRPFAMLKFRTMVLDAPDVRNPDGSTYTGADDPRVTTIGSWLRRTSLDELPQLWNVLRGDMILVGPRPDLPDQIRHYSPLDHRRLEVRPGITGLAQVSGRNDLEWKDRRALDVQYVSTMSFRGDLRILGRTIPGVLGARGIFGRRTESLDHAPPDR